MGKVWARVPRWAASAAAVAGLLLPGCANDPEQPGCPQGSEIVAVASRRELDAAAGSASPGTCLALRSGSYTEVVLPAGVSLVGDGRDDVTLVRVVVSAGDGAVLSTFTVRGLGISLAPSAANVRVDNVRVV